MADNGLVKLGTDLQPRLFGECRRAHFGALPADSFHRKTAAVKRNRDFVRPDIRHLTGERGGGAALQYQMRLLHPSPRLRQ